ncbi:MAG: flagellar export protein FliJ [Desulfatiglandaceae bacterium]|jgi:flagellar protein FliJ
MAFKFRYTSLLNYREHLKEKAEIEHAKALGALLRAREELRSLRRAYGKVQEAFKQAMVEAADGNMIRNYSDYLALIRDKTEKQNREIEALKTEQETKRSALLKKSKECKVIEKLKEKDFEKWQQYQDHLEQIRLNEVAVQRYGKTYM